MCSILHLSLLFLGLVISEKLPPLPGVFRVTILHEQLVLLGVDCKASPAAPMLQSRVLVVVDPVLIPLTPMARVKDDI